MLILQNQTTIVKWKTKEPSKKKKNANKKKFEGPSKKKKGCKWEKKTWGGSLLIW